MTFYTELFLQSYPQYINILHKRLTD